eukprot:7802670-Pyramimonas_sp.AAC.1
MWRLRTRRFSRLTNPPPPYPKVPVHHSFPAWGRSGISKKRSGTRVPHPEILDFGLGEGGL